MSCPGKRDMNISLGFGGHSAPPRLGTCGSLVYKCKKCGSVGCDQLSDGKCTNQNFTSGKCMSCGAVGQKEMIH